MALNAMNCYHRQLADEPPIIAQLLAKKDYRPRWGADVEDSKTPLRADMASAAQNISQCLRGQLEFDDAKKGKHYQLTASHTALPFKRFPGLALPCGFLFQEGENFPLHIYDFALHVYKNWDQEDALLFYVPKLENEEEARYIHHLVSIAEEMIAAEHPEFPRGSTRLMIVLENPRAILRANEIMDALSPYFLGVSLGWHDYLASAARLFKEDHHYRIPVKADPDIVIKHIKASHDLVAKVVGGRGGLALGGMYGVLPLDSTIGSPSFSIALKGFFRDVITQLKRDLHGFWVAHPDFVRIGIALVIAWEDYLEGEKESLEELVRVLFDADAAEEILSFAQGPDIPGLDPSQPLYIRELIVASLGQSDFIPNNHPQEIRYNVFQTLQYLADWLAGNGCVALPAVLGDQPVRIMDDLATTERSRWEVWHEIAHGRFDLAEFMQIALEELAFIKEDQSQGSKIVRIHWDQRTGPWYPVAFHLMLQLMTADEPVEFATELLLPFALDPYRGGESSLQQLKEVDPDKYLLPSQVQRYLQYFEICGCHSFAASLSENPLFDPHAVEQAILNFDENELLEAASHHGDIGASRAVLDHLASQEQAGLAEESAETLFRLQKAAAEYQEKFGFKFLVFATGKTAPDFLQILSQRIKNTREEEFRAALEAIAQIAIHRAQSLSFTTIDSNRLRQDSPEDVNQEAPFPLAIGLHYPSGHHARSHSFIQSYYENCKPEELFDIASLSKSLGTAFALEVLAEKGHDPVTLLTEVLADLSSDWRLSGDKGKSGSSDWFAELRIQDLLRHSALNMHYVNGIIPGEEPRSISELLSDPGRFSYEAPAVKNRPGEHFSYSGAGFLVLEYLMEQYLWEEKAQREKDFIAAVFQAVEADSSATLDFDRRCQQPRALGHWDNGEVVTDPPLWFPPYAAGCVANPAGMLAFLNCLTIAYQNTQGCGPISHDTAVLMLRSHERHLDRESREFMGLDIGLGLFTADMGPNRVAVHQGANDGYRSIYFSVFDGPDAGKAFTVFYGGDNHGVPLIASISRDIISALDIQGFDPSLLSQAFGGQGIPQEELVNQGYKELLFRGIQKPLPAEHSSQGQEPHPFLKQSLLAEAVIQDCSDQRFARVSNLIRLTAPVLDPLHFCPQGKVMDSWETARHNPEGQDWAILSLKEATAFRYVYASTAYHNGNHVQEFALLGRQEGDDQWGHILETVPTKGHSDLFLDLGGDSGPWKELKVLILPDGGFSRLALFQMDPPSPSLINPAAGEKAWSQTVQWHPVPAPIPRPTVHPVIALDAIPDFGRNAESTDWVDLASHAHGGQVEFVSNEHYGPAASLISPIDGLHMFDGLESARSRDAGHYEEAVIRLGQPGQVDHVALDFTHFPNNNPVSVDLLGLSEDSGKEEWTNLAKAVPTKAFAGNTKVIDINDSKIFTKIKLRLHPDGGLNRVHVFGRPSDR
jgi:malate synthase